MGEEIRRRRSSEDHDTDSVLFDKSEQPAILVTSGTPTETAPPVASYIPYIPRPAMTPIATLETFHSPLLVNTTTTNDESVYNGHEPVQLDTLVDRMPKARHTVDYQDMLWTQIDILDDVRQMSESTREKGSFFSKEHKEAVEQLKASQSQLLEQLKLSGKAMDNDTHRVLWESENIDEVRNRLYDREYFKKVSSSLDGVREGLERVGETMRRFER
jgi:hypothetical protein